MIGPKNSDAGSFAVDPAELRNSARILRETIDAFADQPTLKYRLEPNGVGNDTLAAELSEFQRNAEDAVGVLNMDAMDLAEHLADSAAGYETIDSDLADRLSEVIDHR